MGETASGNENFLVNIHEEQSESHIKKNDGYCQDNLYGTYVHGVFDKVSTAETIVHALMKAKGIELEPDGFIFDYDKYRDEQYDLLADTMRKHLDMKAIYRILEEGV